MDNQLPTVPRPKQGTKYRSTLKGIKRNQTLRLRHQTLVLLRQMAAKQGLSISEMCDVVLSKALEPVKFSF